MQRRLYSTNCRYYYFCRIDLRRGNQFHTYARRTKPTNNKSDQYNQHEADTFFLLLLLCAYRACEQWAYWVFRAHVYVGVAFSWIPKITSIGNDLNSERICLYMLMRPCATFDVSASHIHSYCRFVPISTTTSAALIRVSEIKVADINVSNATELISLRFAWPSFIHFRACLVFSRKMNRNRSDIKAIFANCQNDGFDEMRGASFVPLRPRCWFCDIISCSRCWCQIDFCEIYQLHQPHISGEINLSSSGIEYVWINNHIDDGVKKSMRLNFNINMIELEL